MVMGTAYDDAVDHQPNEIAGTQELRYEKGYMDAVDLVITPKEGTAWQTWISALLGIGGFMQQWEYIGLTFNVVLGLGRMGTGRVFQEDGTRVDG